MKSTQILVTKSEKEVILLQNDKKENFIIEDILLFQDIIVFLYILHFFNYDDDDDVYLGYYSGKMVSYKLPCLHVLRKTHKHSRYSISNEHKK
jgi:hypothetical protein